MPRDLKFYTELVIVTVLSLVAAKAWFHWFVRFLGQYFGTSIHIDFLAAVILTLVAIFGLHLLFSRRMKGKDLPPRLVQEEPSQFRPPRRYIK